MKIPEEIRKYGIVISYIRHEYGFKIIVLMIANIPISQFKLIHKNDAFKNLVENQIYINNW